MKKRILAFFMVLVAVLSIVGIKQDTFCAAKADNKTYWIDIQSEEDGFVGTQDKIKNNKMSIKGEIDKSSTEDFAKKKQVNSIKNLKISSKCKCYLTAAGTNEKFSLKSAKKALIKGEFTCAKMKIKNNTVYKIYFHV